MSKTNIGRSSPPNRRQSTKSNNNNNSNNNINNNININTSYNNNSRGTPGPLNSSIISDASEEPNILKQKIIMLEKDLERRQESYISRERAYKTRIDELEEELTRQRTRKTGWMKTDTKLNKLKLMQNQIVNNVELVQDRTARILQEQERDLLRAFRARLFDVQTELEKEKSKKDDGAGAWIERSRQLEAEVEWAKEVADRLERANQSLSSENNRLKAQFKTQEDDRNYLIKQLVAVKKDNARLRAEYVTIEQENATLLEQIKASDEIKQTTILPRVNQARGDQEERYKEANTRLRKLLADERKSLQQVRQNYAQELRSRTELEMLLRACVEDVRKEIARRQIESAQLGSLMKGIQSPGDINKVYSSQPASSIPIDSFAQEDRERALELLLSQERVVTLLYSKVFPVNSNAPSNSATLPTNSIGGTGTSSNNNGTSSRHGGKLINPSIEELLHVAEEDSYDERDILSRPSTTGGLPNVNQNGLNPSSSKPHTSSSDDNEY